MVGDQPLPLFDVENEQIVRSTVPIIPSKNVNIIPNQIGCVASQTNWLIACYDDPAPLTLFDFENPKIVEVFHAVVAAEQEEIELKSVHCVCI